MRLHTGCLELFDAMLYSADFPEGFRSGLERAFRGGREPPAAERAGSRLTMWPCNGSCNVSWRTSVTSRLPHSCARRGRATSNGPDSPHHGGRC